MPYGIRSGRTQSSYQKSGLFALTKRNECRNQTTLWQITLMHLPLEVTGLLERETASRLFSLLFERNPANHSFSLMIASRFHTLLRVGFFGNPTESFSGSRLMWMIRIVSPCTVIWNKAYCVGRLCNGWLADVL